MVGRDCGDVQCKAEKKRGKRSQDVMSSQREGYFTGGGTGGEVYSITHDCVRP